MPNGSKMISSVKEEKRKENKYAKEDVYIHDREY